jgi:ER membrane protein complex subunit 7
VQALPLPLVLRPAGEMSYFEKRKPVDLWAFIKSPYGLMIAFSLFIIVVMPQLKVVGVSIWFSPV